MQRFLQRFGIIVLLAVLTGFAANAQENRIPPTPLPWSTSPASTIDTSIVYSIANIQPGESLVHPGAEVFGKAITNPGAKLFANVQIFVTRIKDDKV
jgi:hypothetical protein